MEPLDYELAVWTMWYAEGLAGSKFTLSGLARSVQQQCVDRQGSRGRLDRSRSSARAPRAIETLDRLDIVQVLDGDLEAYV